jgi:transketolase
MPQGFTFNVFDVDRFATREMYGKVLAELGQRNKNIVVLTADLMRSNKTGDFAKVCPDRFFNFGIAEQNMMAAAAGLAVNGKIPYVSTYAVFASLRCAEQVRTDIAYPKLNVRIVSSHSGLSMGNGGTTHHATEDIAIMRSMANMTVLVPADANECAKAVVESIDYSGPIYIRLGRGAEPIVYKTDFPFRIGKANIVREGKDVSVIACGICVMASIKAARKLEQEGISVRIIDMHTIKPLDKETIVQAAQETGNILTVEEHNIIGGLGSAVAEVLAEEHLNVRFRRLGIPDIYSTIGQPDDLYHRYGLDEEGVYRAIKALILNN